MDVAALQRAIGVADDGRFGPQSRAALIATFTNTSAAAVTAEELNALAVRLGCTLKQLRAVSLVESSGGGFDRLGRPKILFERHLFHRLTKGEFGQRAFSNPKGGGYDASSWDKLLAACAYDPDAAFGACSWGKFQVLGLHASLRAPDGSPRFGFADSFTLAKSTVASEAAHYDLLARYIDVFDLKSELRALSTDPVTCRPFARAYNGSAYEKGGYHRKLAEAMR